MFHGQGGLPDRLAAEELEGRVEGDDGHIFNEALCSQQAVERVAVHEREFRCRQRVRHVDGQQTEILLGTKRFELAFECLK